MKLFPVVFILLASALCTDLRAATLHVANNGADSTACGAQNSPCRSMTQAMANASAGDTILVGPGRYGDLTDGETNFTFPGEEMPPPGSCCLIVVTKPLTIESTHGAAATRLNGGAAFGGVHILANGVVFGRPGKGFTFEKMAGGAGDAVLLDASTSGNSVGGNVAVERGFQVHGSNHTLTHNQGISGEGGDANFLVTGTGHLLSHNLVGSSGSPGFEVQGTGHTLTQNILVGSGVSVSNGATDIDIERNSFLGAGTGFAGVQITFGSTATINENNFFGNWPPVYPPEGNCGVENASGGTIDATNNFWGAATGPGPDPADDVCDVPDTNSITLVTPFATQPFEIPSESPGGGGANGNPIASIDDSISAINNLGLAPDTTATLVQKLQEAKDKFILGDLHDARSKAYSFIVELEAAVVAGNLGTEDANVLLNKASAILAGMKF